MPRFFFHIMDGRAIVDLEGTDLLGIDEVRAEAIRTAGTILSREITFLGSGQPWTMTVADSDGDTVFSLKFEAVAYTKKI